MCKEPNIEIFRQKYSDFIWYMIAFFSNVINYFFWYWSWKSPLFNGRYLEYSSLSVKLFSLYIDKGCDTPWWKNLFQQYQLTQTPINLTFVHKIIWKFLELLFACATSGELSFQKHKPKPGPIKATYLHTTIWESSNRQWSKGKEPVKRFVVRSL